MYFPAISLQPSEGNLPKAKENKGSLVTLPVHSPLLLLRFAVCANFGYERFLANMLPIFSNYVNYPRLFFWGDIYILPPDNFLTYYFSTKIL